MAIEEAKPVDVGSEKIVKGMARYFTEVEGIPLGKSEIDFLLMNVPPVCNYRCKKCFTRAEARKARNPLSLAEWRRVISSGKELGAKNVSILGEGEPLIFNHLKTVIKHIADEGMIPMLATNARELTTEMTDFLYDNNTTVGFSLDTLDATEYEEYCRGNANFSEVIKNIAYARKRFAEAIRTVDGFTIYRLLLHMTVTPQNFYRFKQLRDFCGDDIFFDTQPLADVGIAEEHKDDFGEEETYEQFQRNGHLQYPPMVLSKTEDGKPVCCLFNFGLAVNSSGDVMFDTHAIEPERFIGNIRDFPIEELVSRVKKLRGYFLANFATGYCPVRDNSYKGFVKALKSKINELIWD